MKKILIANRGEIAVRVGRSVREAGLSPVAVYSDADRNSLHVRLCDEAYPLGESLPSQSYLAIPKIIDVAKKARVFAIHPGYGFLSENAEFARACERARITLIGPTSRVMHAMGDKIEARKWAVRSGLPVVPASPPLLGLSEARKEARVIGYPVLLKARAGGGGKGMRVVMREGDLREAFELAESEAFKAFANRTLYLEKYLRRPRHIEAQVMGDGKGRVVTVGLRECSIQRRHQKVIEEAPPPNLSSAARERIARSASTFAASLKYRGAGTVEFLVDRRERFYFLEMNTRLQVEHPVTEWTTGLDLVAWQIDIALNRKFEWEFETRGHAFEARIYAEDPENHFFPSSGKIETLRWPSAPWVRVDSGIEAGTEVTTFYDPLLAKISVWGTTRDEARRRLSQALQETRISGVKTNVPFLQAILESPDFRRGQVWTTFVRDRGPFSPPAADPALLDAALAAWVLSKAPPLLAPSPTGVSPWWRAGLPRPFAGVRR